MCNVTKGYKNIYGVETVPIDIDKDEEACMFIDEQDCKNHFKYYYNEENCLIIEAQKERECPPTIFVPGIILGVIAAIVLIGLAFLLLWKMVTTIHDRREFAKFDKERMMAKWDTVIIGFIERFIDFGGSKDMGDFYVFFSFKLLYVKIIVCLPKRLWIFRYSGTKKSIAICKKIITLLCNCEKNLEFFIQFSNR